ncbi:DUF4013 domain-containing protein [Natronomonas sp. EA1]|uniref:DUF4013 domain-containing protein n=1 Tax=Natronomonas sp. EA1 TaxID=3421655 RepID=UPI003EBBE2F4
MLGAAFDFPTSGSRGPRSVLVGGLLVLVSALLLNVPLSFVDPEAPLRPQAIYLGVATLSVVPVVLLRGYHLRVFRQVTTHAEPEAPGFGGLVGLVGDGLRAVVVAVAYALPVAVFGGLAAAGQFTGELGLTPAVESVLRNVAGVSLVLALFSVLAAAYLLPAALANLAYHGRLGAAFHLRRLVSGTLTEDYVVGWVGALLLQTVAFPVAFALRVLVVGFFLQFIVAVAVRYVWAHAAADGLGLEPTVAPAPEPTEDSTADRPDEPVPAIRPVDPVPAIRPVDPVPAVRPVAPEPAIHRVAPEPAIRPVQPATDGTGAAEADADRADSGDSERSADEDADVDADEETDEEESPPETTIDEWSFGEDRA